MRMIFFLVEEDFFQQTLKEGTYCSEKRSVQALEHRAEGQAALPEGGPLLPLRDGRVLLDDRGRGTSHPALQSAQGRDMAGQVVHPAVCVCLVVWLVS